LGEGDGGLGEGDGDGVGIGPVQLHTCKHGRNGGAEGSAGHAAALWLPWSSATRNAASSAEL
jgi:hypothetical protein